MRGSLVWCKVTLLQKLAKLADKLSYFVYLSGAYEVLGTSMMGEVETLRAPQRTARKKLHVETFGCQMNFSDSEIVCAVLAPHGYDPTDQAEEADVILINTCSIREKAEDTARHRIRHYRALKKRRAVVIGVLGCMAERLKKKFLEEEQIIDLVAGPDAYRDLPRLLEEVQDGRKAINTFLSREETYADIAPVRHLSNGVSAFISIMRGCDNMCSFCVVPFTRGRERSRDPHSIVGEARTLFDGGYREVTLLGQNVDSYRWVPAPAAEGTHMARPVFFKDLLAMVASIDPLLRVRFSTSHPKDITPEVLHTMRAHDNLCKHIHFPMQSGSSRVLEHMHRGYDRASYLKKAEDIRIVLGQDCAISSDIIAGFCSETEEDHKETLSLMRTVSYDYSYMFAYSERPGTLAARRYPDDVPETVKKRRLQEIIQLQQELSLRRNRLDVGKWHKVLVEGFSKRSEHFHQGRNTANKVVVFPKNGAGPGGYVEVWVQDCTAATLIGTKSRHCC